MFLQGGLMLNSAPRMSMPKLEYVFMMTLCFRKLSIKSPAVSSMRGKHQLTAGPLHTHGELEVKPQPQTHL